VTEFEAISDGSMIWGGSGAPTNKAQIFNCVACETEIRKNEALLCARTVVNCPSPSCMESYLLTKSGEGIDIKRLFEDVVCQGCGEKNQVPRRYIMKFYFGQTLHIGCHKCAFKNEVVLVPHVKKAVK